MSYYPLKINKGKKNQVFFNIPSKEWVNKFLNDCFGIKDFDETITLDKNNFNTLLDKFIDYIPEFSLYIRNWYLNFWFVKTNIGFRRLLTITKYFISLYDYNICYHIAFTKNEFGNLKKIMQYRIYKIDDMKPFNSIKIKKNVILHFD